MAMVKPIKTEADYDAALARAWEIWNAPEGSAESEELDTLVDLIEAYEEVHYPMGYPTPAGAIEFIIDQEGKVPEYLGTASEVADVLAGVSPVTPKMAQVLHERFGIPYGSMQPEEPSKTGAATKATR